MLVELSNCCTNSECIGTQMTKKKLPWMSFSFMGWGTFNSHKHLNNANPALYRGALLVVIYD